MFRERTAAKILLPIFTVLMVFSLMVLGFFTYLRFVVIDLDFLKKSIVENVEIDDVYDELVDEILDNESVYEEFDLDYKEAEKVFKQLFDKEFVSFALDETFDAFINGDAEIDEEYIEEWIDDNEDLLKEYGFTRSDVNEFKDHVIEVFEDVVDDASEERVYVFDEIEDAIGMKLKELTDRGIMYSGIFTLVLLIVLFLVCKNKLAPVRNFGISLTIADSILLGFIGIVWLLFQEFSYKSSLDEFVFSIFFQYFKIALMPLIIALITGIVLIVIGAILGRSYVKQFNNQSDLDSTEDEFDYAN